MLSEIFEQPERVEVALREGDGDVRALVAAMHSRDVRQVIIAARGTSDNAATYARYLLEIVTGLPVSLSAPSVYTLYGARPVLRNALVLGISQSGQGPDIAEVLREARVGGALTACITNSSDSLLPATTEFTLLCHAGDEVAVAATKTYTTSMAVIASIAARYAESSRLDTALASVPLYMHAALEVEAQIRIAAERYRYADECAVLSRGLNLCTALEAALKLTETSYVVARPFSGADFLHGPIAMICEGFPCFVYAPSGCAYNFMQEVCSRIHERRGELVVISDGESIMQHAQLALTLPSGVDELVSPMVSIIPGQIFACCLAKLRGHNPDRPRGLTKVTGTL